MKTLSSSLYTDRDSHNTINQTLYILPIISIVWIKLWIDKVTNFIAESNRNLFACLLLTRRKGLSFKSRGGASGWCRINAGTSFARTNCPLLDGLTVRIRFVRFVRGWLCAISVSTTIFMSIISLGFNGTIITIIGFPLGLLRHHTISILL